MNFCDDFSGWSPLPFVTFAVISVGGSLLALLLPETAGTTLNEERAELRDGFKADTQNTNENEL